jgi:hypothetical protein
MIYEAAVMHGFQEAVIFTGILGECTKSGYFCRLLNVYVLIYQI